jgi:adenosylmethionine-8-amino-7-oxononanoate aminotransferase
LNTHDVIESDRAHLVHPLHHPADFDNAIIYAGGHGTTIRDIHGNEYLDGLSGLWNVNVGHGRAELAEAACAQMKELAFFSAYSGSSNIPAIMLAERLVALTEGHMQAVYFTTGGAEANEAAFKTARFYWRAMGKPQKVKFIARQEGYHGVTLQAMSATKMGSYWKMFEPVVPGFLHIQSCYPYRFQGAKPNETIGEAAARELEEMILREGPDTIAGFIGEPIQGAGGVIYPADDYWPRVREICTRHEILLIADEIITGFGRTGRWFAMPHWNVTPDIMSFAKGVTSGYLPLGGMMVTRKIKEAMDSVPPENRWMHGATYSAHPTCCAVALKNIEILAEEYLCENARRMGDRLHRNIISVFGGHSNAGDIRGGKGLFAAVEFVQDRETKRNFPPSFRAGARLHAEMLRHGVVTRTRPSSGTHPATGDLLLFAPPLTVTEAEIDRLVSAAHDAAKAVFSD